MKTCVGTNWTHNELYSIGVADAEWFLISVGFQVFREAERFCAVRLLTTLQLDHSSHDTAILSSASALVVEYLEVGVVEQVGGILLLH